MIVRLTKAARIVHNAGETVEVSPAEAAFLLSIKSAVPVVEAAVPIPAEPVEKRTRARKPRKTETETETE